MKQNQRNSSRKKFLFWSVAALSSFSFLGLLKTSKKTKAVPVKMLTEDGKLVEIDHQMLSGGGRKVSREELQNWIKK